MMFRSFVYRLVILTAGLSVIIAIINFFFLFFQSFQIFSWVGLMFFFMLTIITGYIGLRAVGKSSHGFVAGVNGIVLLKLVLSIAFLIGYLSIAKPINSNFIVSFFALYIFYTVFEIRELIGAQKIKSGEQKLPQHVKG